MTENEKENRIPAHFAHLKGSFVTIVTFGDSITQVNHTTCGGLNWTGFLWMGLVEVFRAGFTIINSGISGDSLTKAIPRLDRDVLRYKPDIAIVSFGTNDAMTTPLDIFQEQLCEVIDRIRDNGACSIVLRTPNPRIDTMLHLGTELAELPQKDGKIVKNTMSSYAQTISRIAEAKKTLLVDHYSLWKKSMESSCRGDFLQLMNDPTHPNTIGHRRLYHELAPIFNGNRNFYYEWERLLRNEGDIA